jgi:hypothetical protein
MFMKAILITSLVILAGIGAAPAAILAQWTFETSQPATSGSFAAENGINAGASLASGFHATTTALTYSSTAGAGSAHSFSSKNWVEDDYYQFTTSTLGYDGVNVSFAATSSGTGPRDFKLAYSTDGTTFSDFTTFSVLGYNVSPNPSWTASMSAGNAALYAFDFDLSSIGDLADQAAIYLRLIDTGGTSASGSTVGTGGTSRVDDVTISASVITTAAVPEPSSFIAGVLLGLPFAVQGLSRRRRSRG